MSVTRLTLIGWVVCVWLAPLRAAERLNVLFLFADDMRADTIGAWGNAHIRTPHLDRLAASGFSFLRHYVFGGNSGAVCVPSRAMLMSGRTWFHVNTASLNDAELLPERLGKHGYVTFATGKWHNGQPSWLRAFQRGKNIMFGGMSDHSRVPVRDLGPDGRLTTERVGEKFSSELFADSVIEFLRQRDPAKPFFAYVAFTAPHDPRMPPLPYRQAYYQKPPPLPANYLPQLPFDNGMMRGGRDENLAAWPRTEAVIRDQLAEYYGLITHMDEQIGRILEALDQTGQRDRTLIIFAADNGLALGSHGLLGKQNVFEHSMRVPMIVAGPGVPRGGSTRAFTYHHDLFPTLCDVLAVPPPSGLEGESLRPLWEGRQERVRDSVFLPLLQQRAVRDERWKLIAYPRIGHLQLFDLENDPHETHNLADLPEYAGHVQRLRALMKQWQQRVGDTIEIPSTNRPPARVDLTGRQREPDQWQPQWIVEKYFESPIRTNYPGANIRVLRRQGATITLAPDLRDTQGWWFHFNFGLTAPAERPLTLQFEERNPIGVRGPAVSLDQGRTWRWLGAHAVKKTEVNGKPVWSFAGAVPAGVAEARFAFAPAYLESHWREWRAGLPPGAPIVVSELCRSRKGRSVELVRAACLDHSKARGVVLLTARHHACESMASYVLDGLLSAALAEDELGRRWRENWQIIAMPFADKDGVEEGDQGKNRAPHDHNRDYKDTPLYPEVAAWMKLGQSLKGRVVFNLDLHCPYISGDWNDRAYIVGSATGAEKELAFARVLERVRRGPIPFTATDGHLPAGTAWNQPSNMGSGRSTCAWARDTFPEARFAATMEIPNAEARGVEVNAESARAFGRDLAVAILEYLE